MPTPSALEQAHRKAMQKKDKRNKSRKFGRNLKKCARYRQRVGKPNGPGAPGQHNH